MATNTMEAKLVDGGDEAGEVPRASSTSGWYKTITKGSFPPCNPTGDDAELRGLGKERRDLGGAEVTY